MAGTDPRFNAATFRTAIRNAMTMGLPGTTADRATFQWTSRSTYTRQDLDHNPYSWVAPPVTTTSHADVLIPVAWEFSARPTSSQQTDVGEFDATRVVITILDVDYALIVGADKVLLGGNAYEISFVAPPVGLFDVTVYTMYAVAEDES